MSIKIKCKCHGISCPERSKGTIGLSLLFILTLAIYGVEGQLERPGHCIPVNYSAPFVQEVAWVPERDLTSRKTLSPPRFQTRSVQLVANRHNYYVISAPQFRPVLYILMHKAVALHTYRIVRRVLKE